MSSTASPAKPQAVRAFTNEVWRHREAEMVGHDVPLVTMTAQRVTGTGPVRTGHVYEVRQDGAVVGRIEVVGRSWWATFRADGSPGNTRRHPYVGTLESVVWALRVR